MKKVELCIFDVDGLLLDTEKQMWAFNESKAAKELGYDIEIEDFADCMGGSRENNTKKILSKYGDDFPAKLFWEKVEHDNDLFIKQDRKYLMPGAYELLEFLKANNITCAVATSTVSERSIPILKKQEVFDYFDFCVFGDQIENGKPAPDIYLKVYNHYDYPKENILIFEDSHFGSRAAISSGMNLVLVPDIAVLEEQDKEEAFAVVPSLFEVIDLIKKINHIG